MNYQEKKFLVIGAGELQIPLIQAAKKLGLTVVATDNNPTASGFSYTDYNIIADTMNPIETLKAVQQFIADSGEIHGIATAGTDASYTVAYTAFELNLPGHHPEAALRASNKSLMRETFAEAGIPIPKFKKASNFEDALEFFQTMNAPCVLKPTQNMGARGISLVSTEADLAEACELAYKYNRHEKEFLIEEYINAHELSIDALVENDHIIITGIADRIIEYTPYFVETGHILPSNLPEDWIKRAVSTFKQGIKALGLTHGAAKVDLKISKDNTWIIEIAARLSGGFMSSHTFPFATGIHLHEYMVKLALGESLPEKILPTKNLVSIERAIIAVPGIITDISIPNNIMDSEYIHHLSLRAKVGDHIYMPKNNLDKAGNIIAVAPTRELGLRSINDAIRKIIITTQSDENQSQILSQSNSKAKELLKNTCNVCNTCDGLWCRGKIPGVGGVGTGEGFIQAYEQFRRIKIIPKYIHNIRTVDTSIEMFGLKLSMPVFTAPIGGAGINYNNAVSELEFQRAFIKGAYQAGTLGFIADPAQRELFDAISQTILENYGHSIPICKPRIDLNQIKERYKNAVEAGAVGLGTDIDGIGLKTFHNASQNTCPKNSAELKELISLYKLPFVIKGVLSIQDALQAVDAGATHIIVSSHGGRIGEAFPIPIEILPMIRKEIGNSIPILIDGAIRSGADVVKALILGADAVLIGRTVAIHAVGGGARAVRSYLKTIQQQLESLMLLLGKSSIEELKGSTDLLHNYPRLF